MSQQQQQHPRPPTNGEAYPAWANGHAVPATVPSPYDEPNSLFSVTPFVHYTPTARVTEHFATHTVSYTPPVSSESVYPQYAPTLGRMDQPQTPEDVRARDAAQTSIAAALNGASSYGNLPYATPASSGGVNGMTFPAGGFQAMAYSFLPATPSSVAGSSTQPPTPASITPSPAAPSPANSHTDLFEHMIEQGLRLTTPTPSAQTPSQRPAASRQPAPSSPDPLAMGSETGDAPSPSKKARLTPSGGSPSRRVIEITPPKLSTAQKSMYRSMVSSTSGHQSTASMRSTPVKDDESDDDIDWGETKADRDGDWLMRQEPPPAYPHASTSAAARTGDKDERTSFQKLQNLLEDIFEESDSFSANPSREDVAASRFFAGLSANGEHPLLSVDAMHKLVNYFTRLHKSKKPQRQAQSDELPWDADMIMRLLRLLERSMTDAKDLNPFPDNGRRTVIDQTSPKKKGKKGKKAGSEAEPSPEPEVTYEEKMSSERTLAAMTHSAAAALCCLVVLRTPQLPKQLYSEDLLTMAVTTVRDQMTNVLFPIIEGLAGEKMRSSYLVWLVTEESSAAAKGKGKKAASFAHDSVASIANSTCAAVPHIAGLVNKPNVAFGDTLIINTVYLALGPIFVHEPATRRGLKGKETGGATWAVMKSLRSEALACLRIVFAKYETQRQWILEEILGQLGKSIESGATNTRYQLSDGTSINTLSALFLQLVQAFSHGVGPAIRKLRQRHMNFETGEQDLQSTVDEEMEICHGAIDKAGGCMLYLSHILLRKSIASKQSRNAQDIDYSVVLTTLVNDLLAVIYRPEWPAAALFLNLLAKTLLEEPDKIKGAVEANAARSIALDYLGEIAAKIRTMDLEMHQRTIIPSFKNIVQDANVDGLTQLLAAHNRVQAYLTASTREDGMFVAAGEMTRVLWASEVFKTLKHANAVLERLAVEPEEVAQAQRLQNIVHSLRKVAREVWGNDLGNVFDTGGSNQAEEALEASMALARCNSLQEAFKMLLYALTQYMDASVIGQRAKALRGLSLVVVADPEILADSNVRMAIEDRLADSSPSVRDAAVDLIGKYVVQRSELAVQYFPHLSARVTDTGLGVRKRVVKLLRDMFAASDNDDLRISICCKLVVATEDEDDGVKDLAIKSLTEIIYPPTGFVAATSAALLVDILHKYEGSTLSLETAIQGLHHLCTQNGNSRYFGETIDALINRMVDATEDTDFDASSHIRAIYLLSLDDPALIDTNKAAVLLAYLRQPNNTEEQKTNDQLLQIFVRCIPFLPKASSTFANDLSKTLRVMATKPTGAPPTLRWIITGYCVVVKHLTHEYQAMASLLRGCHDKIRAARLGDANANPQLMRQVSTLHYIAALIVECGGLDEIAAKDEHIRRSLAPITDGSLAAHFFGLFLRFSRNVSNQQMPILCLSAVFRANPQLILDEKTAKWMAELFKTANTETKARLLELVHDFLVSESKRRLVKGKKSKGINDLIGAGSELNESVVSSAVVQRTIDFVTEGAKSDSSMLQSSALDVLAFIINQGLYHPVVLLHVLIPLETSEDRHLAGNALALHTTLHTKHPSTLNVTHLDFVRESYDYLRTLSSEVTANRRGAAALGGWYGLLSEKRAWKLDFLRAVTKAFEFDLAGSEPIDAQFVLFVAENLVLFEYGLQEEVMTVVQALSHVVHDGLAVANAIELGQVLGGDAEPLGDKMAIISESEQMPARRIANASLVVGTAVLAKNLLLEVYGLTEDKCLKLERGKKSTVGDKPVSKKEQYQKDAVPLNIERLPLVREGIETLGDYRLQQGTILELLRDDGALGWSSEPRGPA